MSKCRFCEEFKLVRDHEHHDLRYEYTVSLDKSVYDGKHFVGRTRRSSYDLRFCPECGKQLDGEEKPCGDCPAIFAVKAMAASDLPPVVRCKDCKWYQIRKWDDGAPEYDCRKTQGLLDVRPEDFCSYGERRRADGKD